MFIPGIIASWKSGGVSFIGWDASTNIGMTGVTSTVANYPGATVDPTRLLTNKFVSSGKYYFEWSTSGGAGTGANIIGLVPSSFNGVFFSSPTFYFYPFNNSIYIDGSVVTTIGGSSFGAHVISVAWNADSEEVTIRVDNSIIDGPRSWSPGVDVGPMVRGDASASPHNSTAVWDPGSFTYTPPSGFVSWFNAP